MKTALYLRISTDDERQTIANQLAPLTEFAKHRGWEITHIFEDQISGAGKQRPSLDAMLAAASRGEFQMLLVWDLSRLTREGPASAFGLIERLKQSGVDFCSYREEYFRTAGPAGPMLIAVAAYLAQQERATMSARTIAGLERARKQGKRLGRPRRTITDSLRRSIWAQRGAGVSIRAIAEKEHVTKATVEQAIRSYDL